MYRPRAQSLLSDGPSYSKRPSTPTSTTTPFPGVGTDSSHTGPVESDTSTDVTSLPLPCVHLRSLSTKGLLDTHHPPTLPLNGCLQEGNLGTPGQMSSRLRRNPVSPSRHSVGYFTRSKVRSSPSCLIVYHQRVWDVGDDVGQEESVLSRLGPDIGPQMVVTPRSTPRCSPEVSVAPTATETPVVTLSRPVARHRLPVSQSPGGPLTTETVSPSDGGDSLLLDSYLLPAILPSLQERVPCPYHQKTRFVLLRTLISPRTVTPDSDFVSREIPVPLSPSTRSVRVQTLVS